MRKRVGQSVAVKLKGACCSASRNSSLSFSVLRMSAMETMPVSPRLSMSLSETPDRMQMASKRDSSFSLPQVGVGAGGADIVEVGVVAELGEEVGVEVPEAKAARVHKVGGAEVARASSNQNVARH